MIGSTPAGWMLDSLLLFAVTSAFLYVVFRKRLWGLFDPMLVFLVMRVATGVAAIALVESHSTSDDSGVVYVITATIALVMGLSLTTPSSQRTRNSVPGDGQKFGGQGLCLAAVITAIKGAILIAVAQDLPILAEQGGSDVYVTFDEAHKIASAVLLGLGQTDIVLCWAVLPLVRGWSRGIAVAILSVALFVTAAFMKKSGLLSVFMALALAEYLRRDILEIHAPLITRPAAVILTLVFASGWAWWVLSRSLPGLSMMGIESGLDLAGFTLFQFEYLPTLIMNGTIAAFTETHTYSALSYFAHSFLLPIGFSSFDLSIGPALHEFQTGDITGQGVNPTFLGEGFVLFGAIGGVLYSFIVGLIVGWVRRAIVDIRRPLLKLFLAALFLMPLYVLPVDSLLFIKMATIAGIFVMSVMLVTLMLEKMLPSTRG